MTVFKTFLILSLVYSFFSVAQDQAEQAQNANLEASASITCEGVTKDSIKEQKRVCSALKDKTEKKECKRDLKVAKKCLKKNNRGKKVCDALVKLMIKRTRESIKKVYQDEKSIKKDLLSQLKTQKRTLLKRCKSAGLDG